MVKKEVKNNCIFGVHSRPAVLIVKKVREYPFTKITFIHKDKLSSGDSLIGLLTLGIQEGATVVIQVEGQDEERVLEEIADFFSNLVISEA
jgi:phosphotransferase system HPr (HPr) family protein